MPGTSPGTTKNRKAGRDPGLFLFPATRAVSQLPPPLRGRVGEGVTCTTGRVNPPPLIPPRKGRGTPAELHHRSPQSSGSTLMIEAPSLLPTQKLTGVVELSTKTLRILVERGRR